MARKRYHLDDIPRGSKRDTYLTSGWQHGQPFQDPRGTRSFYEGRRRIYAAQHGISPTEAGRTPEFKQAWMVYRRNIGYEATQHRAAEAYGAAERMRSAGSSPEARATYRRELARMYNMDSRDQSREYARLAASPMTRRQYEDIVRGTMVPRGADSEYARILRVLGLRTAAATWDVGSTP